MKTLTQKIKNTWQQAKSLAKVSLLVAAGMVGSNESNAFVSGLNFSLNQGSHINVGMVIEDSQSYTKEAWIKAVDNQSANIITGSNDPFWLNGGRLRAAHGWQTSNPKDVWDPAEFPKNVWVHVAVTYDVNTQTLRLYKNGVEVAVTTNVPPIQASYQQVGAFNDGNVFDGDMDEVRIWSRALCAPEIQMHMNCELQGNEPDLEVYYNFNEGLPLLSNLLMTNIADASGNGNEGVLVNFNLLGSVANFVSGKTMTAPYVAFTPPSATITKGTPGAASTLLTANTAAAYQWLDEGDDIPGATAQTYTAAPGTYTVRITAANGCSNESTPVTVTVSTSGSGSSQGTIQQLKGYITMANNPVVAGQDEYTIYKGYGAQSVKLTASATGGVGPYTYSWYVQSSYSCGGYSSLGTGAIKTFSPGSTKTFIVKIKDAQGRVVYVTRKIYVRDVRSGCSKIYICHKSSYSNNTSSQSVYTSQVASHLSHGDKLGFCNYWGSCRTAEDGEDSTGLDINDGNITGEEDMSTEQTDAPLSAEGINLGEMAREFNVFPNPTTGLLTLNLPETGDVVVIVTDMMGKKVYEYSEHIDEYKMEINLGTVASGMYMVNVKSGDKMYQAKITKQ